MVRGLLAAKGATATREQAAKLEAAVWSARRNHEGRGVGAVGEGKPARWRLAEGADGGGPVTKAAPLPFRVSEP
jgi:hypothetical protein